MHAAAVNRARQAPGDSSLETPEGISYPQASSTLFGGFDRLPTNRLKEEAIGLGSVSPWIGLE